ncbi:MAG: hypothetical protein U1E67_11670 [Hyphomicrobiales bacterium]
MTDTGKAIEIRVDEIDQLFDTLDPYPFPERDLDKDAEEYIFSWARELPHDQPIRIVVHFPDSADQMRAAQALSGSFARYFAYRAGTIGRDLNELFRIGRRSLLIGVPILVACLVIARIAASYFSESAFRRLFEESLLILGWVANWRPLEIFLYDWWPITRRRDLYRRLAAAKVELKPYAAGSARQ